MLAQEGEDVNEETYGIAADRFQDPSKEDRKLLLQLSYVDIKDETERALRPKAEHHILEVSKGNRRVLSDSFYGIPLAVNGECAVLIEERALVPPRVAADEKESYMKRLEKTATRFQVTLLVKEITSRKRLGVTPELESVLNDVLVEAARRRDLMSATTDLEELAEHPNAVVRNWRLLNMPDEDEAAAAAVVVDAAVSAAPLSEFKKKQHKKEKNRKKKKNKKNKTKISAAALGQQTESLENKKEPLGTQKTRLFILRFRKQKKNQGLSWHEDRETVECAQNTQVALFENMLCVAETLKSDQTRVRLFKVYKLDEPVFTKSIEGVNLGVVCGVSMTKKDAFVLRFCNHVVCCVNQREPLVLSFDTDGSTTGSDSVAAKESPRSNGSGKAAAKESIVALVRSVTMLENYEVAVGTSKGQIHIYDGTTGSSLQVLYLPSQLPVISLGAHGSILYAQMQYCIVRFHPEGNLIPPYVFRSGFCAGVSGYGALLATLNECGAAWITNTFTTGVVRNIEPPAEISYAHKLTPGPSSENTIRRLASAITAHYDAIHLTKDALYILYPCAKVVVVEFA